jgi:hypothetical protein
MPGLRQRANDITFANWTCPSACDKPRRSITVRTNVYMSDGLYLHALRMEFMTTRETHNLTDAINILLQTNDTLSLTTAVTAPPSC